MAQDNTWWTLLIVIESITDSGSVALTSQLIPMISTEEQCKIIGARIIAEATKAPNYHNGYFVSFQR